MERWTKIKESIGLGNAKPKFVHLTVPEGTLQISLDEQAYFNDLFDVVDNDGDDQIAGAEGALFLSRSGLTRDQLREVWRLSCGGVSKPRLNRDNWSIACKIVAQAQTTGVCDLGPLLEHKPTRLPQFQFDVKPVADQSPLPPLPPAAIKVQVGTPVSVGSALTKHIEYTVSTSTSLPQFPVKEMSVMRRYSDFLWLHGRLCTVFPGCLIPRFPEKKMVGNMDASFVEDRRAALENYIDKVAHHSRLVTSVDLMVFFGASPKAFLAARRVVDANTAIYNGGIDLMKLVGSVTGGSRGLVIKADEEFVTYCSRSSDALSRLTSAVTSSRNYLLARKSVAYELSRVGSYSSTIGVHERAGATAGAGAEAAAEARKKEAQKAIAGLSTGAGAGAGAGASMSAAEAAFAAHARAESSKTGNTIEDMFNVDFGDPFASTVSVGVDPIAEASATMFVTPEEREAERRARVDKIEVVENTGELFSRLGAEVEALALRLQDQMDTLDSVFFSPMEQEQEKEAELQEAAARRSAAGAQLQAANNLVTRRKRSYATIRARPDGGVGGRAEQAEVEVAEAEARLEDCKAALTSITDGLKADMVRVEKQRRVNIATRLVELVKSEALHAKGRATTWTELLPFISQDREELDASYARVTAVPEVEIGL